MNYKSVKDVVTILLENGDKNENSRSNCRTCR